MPSVVRVCPEGSDEAAEKDACFVGVRVLRGNLCLDGEAPPPAVARAGRFAEGKYERCFGPDASDADVCGAIAPDIVKRVSARECVTVVTHGQPATGKSKTAHALLLDVAKRLRETVSDAHEAWDDLLNGLGPQGSLEDRPKSPNTDPFNVQPAALPRRLPPVQNPARKSGGSQRSKSLGWEARASIGGGAPLSPIGPAGRQRQSLKRQSVREVASGQALPRRSEARVSIARPSVARPEPEARPGSPSRRQSSAAAGSPGPVRSRQSLPRGSLSLPGGMTSLRRGNGRRGKSEAMWFDGETSFVRLPVLPHLDRVILRGFTVDFWIKPDVAHEKPSCVLKIKDKTRTTPCMSVMLNYDINHATVPGTMLFQVADLEQKSAEVQASCDLLDGEWHHVKWTVIHLQDHKLQCCVDGDQVNLKIGACDGPTNFPHWTQLGVVGGDLMDERQAGEDGAPAVQLDQGFRGMLAELSVWIPDEDDPSEKQLLTHWALDSVRAEDDEASTSGGAVTCKDLTGGGFDAAAKNIVFQPTVFPDTAVAFDGRNAHVNVGQLGIWGGCLGSFVIEFWVQTTETKRAMSVMGVRDTSHRHPGFGIEFNSTAFNRLSPCRLCFWMRDCTEQYFPVTVESQKLFDGEWHHVRWQVTDPYMKKMKVNVDKQSCELEFPAPNPTHQAEFAPYTQYVALGAQNDRGTLKGHFTGLLRGVKFWRGREEELLAHWALDEGCGAKIAMDKTGCGHNGVFFSGKKKMSRWEPSKGVEKCGPSLGTDTLEALDGVQPAVVHRHRNNKLQLACVAFGVEADDGGKYQEVVYDVVHGDFVPGIDAAPHFPHDSSRFSPDSRADTFPCVLQSCYEHEMIRPEKYMDVIKDVLSRLQEDDLKRCHSVFTLRIGDGSFTVVDLLGHQLGRRSAAFDAVHLTWSDTVATMGGEGKRKVTMNRTLAAVQKGLVEMGPLPQIVKRCTALSANMRDRLRAAFDGADVARVTLGSALRGEPHSTLYNVFTVSRRPTVDELVAANALSVRLRSRAEHWAAVMIQKIIRAALARMGVRLLTFRREEARDRTAAAAEMRKARPQETEAKAKRFAVLIGIGRYEHAPLPELATAEADCELLERALPQLGYEVLRFRTGLGSGDMPTRDAVRKALTKARRATQSADTLVLVFVQCYGVNGHTYRQLPLSVTVGWLSEHEAHLRSEAETEETGAWGSLRRMALQEAEAAEDAVKRREEEEARRESRRKSRGGGQKRRTSQSPVVRPSSPKPEERPGTGGSRRRSSASPSPRSATKRGSVSPAPKGAAPKRNASGKVSIVEQSTKTDEDAAAGKKSPPATEEVPEPAPKESPQAPPEAAAVDEPVKCKYLLPYDVGGEFDPSTVLMLDDVVSEVVGDGPRIGHQSIVVVDAPAIGVSPGSDPTSGGFGCIAASSGQSVNVEYGKGQRSLLSHYFIKALLGNANRMPVVRPDEKPQLFDHVSVEQVFSYLRLKLGSGAIAERRASQLLAGPDQQPRFNDLRSFVVEPHGSYIGEFVLAGKPLVSKRDRQVAKTRGRGRKQRARCLVRLTFGGGLTPTSPEIADKLLSQALTAFALTGDAVEVRARHYQPSICIEFAEGDWDTATKRGLTVLEWERVYAKLIPADDGTVVATPRLEPCPLRLRWMLSAPSLVPPASRETPLKERDRLEAMSSAFAAFAEGLYTNLAAVQQEQQQQGSASAAPVLAGFAVSAVHMDLRLQLQTTAVEPLQKLARASRLSFEQHQRLHQSAPKRDRLPEPHPAVRVIHVYQLTEAESKAHERWESDLATEEKHAFEVARQQRLAEIAEQRREQDRVKAEERRVQEVREQIPVLMEPGMLGRLDERKMKYILSVEEADTWGMALDCIAAHAEKDPAAATLIANLGGIPAAHRGLLEFGADASCTRHASRVIRRLAGTAKPRARPKLRPKTDDEEQQPDTTPVETFFVEALPEKVFGALCAAAESFVCAPSDVKSPQAAEAVLDCLVWALSSDDRAKLPDGAAELLSPSLTASCGHLAADRGEPVDAAVVRKLLTCVEVVDTQQAVADAAPVLRLAEKAAVGTFTSACAEVEGADAARRLEVLGMRVWSRLAQRVQSADEPAEGSPASVLLNAAEGVAKAVAGLMTQQAGVDPDHGSAALRCLTVLHSHNSQTRSVLRMQDGVVVGVCTTAKLHRDADSKSEVYWQALSVVDTATMHIEAGNLPADVRIPVSLLASECRSLFAADQEKAAIAAAVSARAVAPAVG
eukprot:TRINITY_DN5961_c0_g1_i1.p1 TRINITY_DN5961_c0_g1~~TRINITY_DN5961_c0_g1_i1.p1  ORF type:complete len:2257 (+),score=703.93 TRINITY_DN5961_c0_g1_i1:53-6772(+)